MVLRRESTCSTRRLCVNKSTSTTVREAGPWYCGVSSEGWNANISGVRPGFSTTSSGSPVDRLRRKVAVVRPPVCVSDTASTLLEPPSTVSACGGTLPVEVASTSSGGPLSGTATEMMSALSILRPKPSAIHPRVSTRSVKVKASPSSESSHVSSTLPATPSCPSLTLAGGSSTVPPAVGGRRKAWRCGLTPRMLRSITAPSGCSSSAYSVASAALMALRRRSYQKRSPSRSRANCSATLRAKSGPSRPTPPDSAGFLSSARPPTSASSSDTLNPNASASRSATRESEVTSAKVVAGGRPSATRASL